MSNTAKDRYAPGSSRGGLSVVTFHGQMADVARADRLRALRDAHRLTQPDMADRAGISLRAYQAWERTDNPGGVDFDHVKQLAATFEGVDPESLVERRNNGEATVDPARLGDEVQALHAKLDLIIEYMGIVDDGHGHPAVTYGDAYQVAAKPATPEAPSGTLDAK